MRIVIKVGTSTLTHKTGNLNIRHVEELCKVMSDLKGYMKLFIPCGGADDPRPIKMRQRGSDGKWFLWEQYLLTGVRTPKAADPWA